MENNEETYKVIKIIDEYNIVVNAGNYDGIKEKDKLEIFIKGEPLKDPESGETLGTLDTIKAKVIVKQVFERFCICGNVKTIPTFFNIGSIYSANQEEKLNIDPKEITGGFVETDDKIKIGDLVRKSLSQD